MANVNITLSADERLVRAARQAARRQGTSLNELVRRYLETLAGARTRDDVASELRRLSEESNGRSGGRRFDRDELYEERVGRPRLH